MAEEEKVNEALFFQYDRLPFCSVSHFPFFKHFDVESPVPPPITIIYTTYLLTSWPPFLFPGTMLRRTFLSLSLKRQAQYKETFYHVNPPLCDVQVYIDLLRTIYISAHIYLGFSPLCFTAKIFNDFQILSHYTPIMRWLGYSPPLAVSILLAQAQFMDVE